MDKALSVFSIVISFVILFVSFFIVPNNEGIPWVVIFRDILIFIVIATLALYWFFRYMRQEIILRESIQSYKRRGLEFEGFRKEHEKTIKDLQTLSLRQLRSCHEIVHEFRNVLFRSFQPHQEDLVVRAEEGDMKAFEEICDSVTRSLKDSLLEHFSSRCIELEGDLAITVKLIIPTDRLVAAYSNRLTEVQQESVKNRDLWVITVYRDPETYAKIRSRETGTQIYDITRNTAFSLLIENKLDAFICDNLNAYPSYLNENTEWYRHYNSTLVMPIRYYNKEEDEFACFGILAVDSLNETKHKLFEKDDMCFEIVAHAADLLADFFLTLSLYQYYELFQE